MSQDGIKTAGDRPSRVIDFPAGGPKSVDIDSLDRYLNVVSLHSQRLYNLGYLALLMVAGNECAEIEFSNASADRIEQIRRSSEDHGSTQEALERFVSSLEWRSLPASNVVGIALLHGAKLARALRTAWETWESAADSPLPAEDVRPLISRLHGFPEDEQVGDFAEKALRLASVFRHYANAVERAARLHPFVVMSEIDQALKWLRTFRDDVFSPGRNLTSEVITQDSSHLLDESHRGVRAYFLSHKYGMGATEIGRLTAPHLKDPYGVGSDALKWVECYLQGYAGQEFDLVLGTDYAATFADDLTIVLPKFEPVRDFSAGG